jgi:hypothetical protein
LGYVLSSAVHSHFRVFYEMDQVKLLPLDCISVAIVIVIFVHFVTEQFLIYLNDGGQTLIVLNLFNNVTNGRKKKQHELVKFIKY